MSIIQNAFEPGENEVEDRVERAELDLGRLLLLVQTLSRMLVEKGVCTEEELIDLALRIDKEDGVEDGRVTPAAHLQCDRCGRTIPSNRAKCIYCKSEVAAAE